MKIVVLISRILLGLVFLVFGLNGFLMFIPTGPMPTGLAGQFVTVLLQSHYVLVVSALQVAGGALLLVNRYVPLGLTLLGPIIVNIFLVYFLVFHLGGGISNGLAILLCLRGDHPPPSFAGLFVQKS